MEKVTNLRYFEVVKIKIDSELGFCSLNLGPGISFSFFLFFEHPWNKWS